MTTEEQRKAFEEWVARQSPIFTLEPFGNGGYRSFITQCAWEAYQKGFENGKGQASEPQWIKASERMPTSDDADCNRFVWISTASGVVRLDDWRTVQYSQIHSNPHSIYTHWMLTGIRKPSPPTTPPAVAPPEQSASPSIDGQPTQAHGGVSFK